MKDKDIGLRLEQEAEDRDIPLDDELRARLREAPNEPIPGTVAQAESQSLDEGTSIKARAAPWTESDALGTFAGQEDGKVAAAPDALLRKDIKPMHAPQIYEEVAPEPDPPMSSEQRIEKLTRELVAFYHQYGVMPASVLDDICNEFHLQGKVATRAQLEHEFNRLVAPAEYARQVVSIYLRNADQNP